MAQIDSRSRSRVASYTSAIIISISSAVYLAVVPFLPAAPIVPILVGAALGAVSLKNRGISMATLYLLVYFSVLWQLIGFGFFQLLSTYVGVAVLLAMAVPLLPFMVKRVEVVSMALAILAVALMLTPAYFISVPLLAAAALAFGGFASLEALTAAFVLLLTPFLLLENALYFTLGGGATPIVFSEFSLLEQNFRPSLPGFNVLLTGLPANYLSHSALPVSIWLAKSSSVLLIPMVIFGVILVTSSSLGGVARTLIERFERSREMKGGLRLVLAPLMVAVLVPTIFTGLLLVLSRPGSGGFETALTNDPSHIQLAYMLGSSLILTTSFVGRESLILRLESVQVGSDELEALIGECQAKIDGIREVFDSLERRVPSISMNAERQAVSDYSTTLIDVQRQLIGASGERIAQLRAQMTSTVLKRLEEEPESIRRRLVAEIRGLIFATATANNHLEEAGVALRYPEVPEVYDSDLESLVAAYESAAAGVKKVTGAAADLYSSESAALDVVMGQEEIHPPVSVAALLESNELVSAMRLVAEEYWLNFSVRWADQVQRKKDELAVKVRDLEGTIGGEENSKLHGMEAAIEAAKPSNSTQTLAALQGLRALIEGLIVQAASGSDRVGKMVESLELKSKSGVRFETMNRLGEIVDLRKRLDKVAVTFDSLTRFLTDAVVVLRSQTEAWRSDRESLVLLAQYPLARRIIEGTLKGQSNVALSKLPFQRKTAGLYAQIYAAATQGVEYDLQSDSLRVEKASA